MAMPRFRQGLTGDVLLWAGSAVLVLAAHGGIAAAIVNWPQASDPSGAPMAAIIELAPISEESAAEQANLPVAPPEEVQPEQQEQDEVKPDEPKPEEEQVVEQPPASEAPPPEPPPPEKAEITLPDPTPPPPPKKPPPKKKIATAVERAENVARRQKAVNTGVATHNPNSMRSYAVSVIRPHILRFYNFPESARAKGEHGSVVVSFSITRSGRLISRRIAKSSGHAELDTEALATLQRAQPYPPPPPDLTDQQFTFSLPMNYNIR
jgi:protein TonB